MKIVDVLDLPCLISYPEEISVKTSEKVRKIKRYCDVYRDSKATSIYRSLQPYDKNELNTLNGWRLLKREPKDHSYLFEMRSNDSYGQWFWYCFAEDTRPFTDEEKKAILEYKREQRERLKEQKAYEEYENGTWLTSWQLLNYCKRKIKDGAIPRKRFNTFYDEGSNQFYEAKKAFYYYNLQDTEEVEEAEFERLKASYIEKYGGWDIIDLDNTTYDGKAWY